MFSVFLSVKSMVVAVMSFLNMNISVDISLKATGERQREASLGKSTISVTVIVVRKFRVFSNRDCCTSYKLHILCYDVL